MAKKKDKPLDPAQCVAALNSAQRHIQSDTMRGNVREAAALLRELIEYKADATRREAERTEKADKLYEIGKNCAAALKELVAALNCDYDRLDELRDERKELAEAVDEAKEALAQTSAGPDATAANQALIDASDALESWDDENGDELKELTEAAGDCTSRENAERRIREDPLSLEVTFTPCSPGEKPEIDGFTILLGTGGPATRIVGELDANNEPKRAWVEAQDWFLPWTEYHGDAISHDDLLAYCRCFKFYGAE